MSAWVALLRGVNVNGITIVSAELAAVFRELGFTNVRTVLASGNVCFETERTDASAIKSEIESALRAAFDYEAWIVLVAREHLARVVADFPFDAGREGWHPYVLFGSEPAVLHELLTAAGDIDAEDDIVAAGDGVLYWHNRREIGVGSAFAKIASRARYRSTTTNRNLRTLAKLI